VPPPNLILSHFQGTPSFAVVVLSKFLRAYLEDVSTNIQVAQSDVVLRFLSLLSPFRAIKTNCLEQLKYLHTKATEEKCSVFEATNKHGHQPMHLAAERNAADMIAVRVGQLSCALQRRCYSHGRCESVLGCSGCSRTVLKSMPPPRMGIRHSTLHWSEQTLKQSNSYATCCCSFVCAYALISIPPVCSCLIAALRSRPRMHSEYRRSIWQQFMASTTRAVHSCSLGLLLECTTARADLRFNAHFVIAIPKSV